MYLFDNFDYHIFIWQLMDRGVIGVSGARALWLAGEEGGPDLAPVTTPPPLMEDWIVRVICRTSAIVTLTPVLRWPQDSTNRCVALRIMCPRRVGVICYWLPALLSISPTPISKYIVLGFSKDVALWSVDSRKNLFSYSWKSTAIPCPNNDIYVNHLFVLIKTFENILNPRAFYLKYLLRHSFVHRIIKLISIWISIIKKWLNHLYILFVITIFWCSSSLFRALVYLWIIQNIKGTWTRF